LLGSRHYRATLEKKFPGSLSQADIKPQVVSNPSSLKIPIQQLVLIAKSFAFFAQLITHARSTIDFVFPSVVGLSGELSESIMDGKNNFQQFLWINIQFPLLRQNCGGHFVTDLIRNR
jgi:hypothetical protein